MTIKIYRADMQEFRKARAEIEGELNFDMTLSLAATFRILLRERKRNKTKRKQTAAG